MLNAHDRVEERRSAVDTFEMLVVCFLDNHCVDGVVLDGVVGDDVGFIAVIGGVGRYDLVPKEEELR